MEHSKFYKSSPAGDEIIRRGRDFARQYPVSDVTHRFLLHIIHDPDLYSLYTIVPDHGNLHCEIGRQNREELSAEALRYARKNVKGGPHKTYTPLQLR